MRQPDEIIHNGKTITEWLEINKTKDADLRDANLSDANLRGANLRGANLRDANLSGCKGLLKSAAWMKENFSRNELGYIVYKRIGETSYPAPDNWVIEPGQYLEEVCNPLPTLDCACGVNFGTLKWCENEYTNAVLWECIIPWEDAPSIVVPYNTDGKARCERLLLVKVV